MWRRSVSHQRSSCFSFPKNLVFCGALLYPISQFRLLNQTHAFPEGLGSDTTPSLDTDKLSFRDSNTSALSIVSVEGPTPLLQGQPLQQQQSVVKNAILHIGPYKTGSTTIQTYSKTLREPLLKDGYEMPYSHRFSNGTRISKPWENQVQFATCFFHNAKPPMSFERKKYPCRSDLLEAGLDIGQQHQHSILLSAETFSALEEEGVKALYDYLYPAWNNITIIAYYRRYYDWILSFHNEISKTKDPWPIFERNSTDLLWRSIVDDLTSNSDWLERLHHTYILTLIPRYEKYFPNIVVVNMHDQSERLQEHFYCELMPRTPKTCEALRHLLSRSRLKANKSSQRNVYLELSYAAHRKGMVHIKTKEHCANVVDAIQGYQEGVLQRTVADFPRRCLPEKVLDNIWNTSVQAEKVFGNVSANGQGALVAQKDHFDKLSKSAFCEVDFDAILGTSAWRYFFKIMSPSIPGNGLANTRRI